MVLSGLDPPSGLLDLGREHGKQATHTLEFSLYPFGFLVGNRLLARASS